MLSAFIAKKQDAGWCHDNLLNNKSLKRALEIRNQIKRYCRRFRIPIQSCNGDTVAIRKCIVSGYFANAAQLQGDGTYRTLKENRTLHIHPSSVLFQVMPEWVIYHEIVYTSKGTRVSRSSFTRSISSDIKNNQST